MIKVSKVLRAACRWDFQGGDEDQWIFDLVDVDYSGGVYEPANFSGHPDSWSDDGSEDPEITHLVLDFWKCPTDERGNFDSRWLPDNEPPYARITFDHISGFQSTAPLPEGVEQFIENSIEPKLIERWWSKGRY